MTYERQPVGARTAQRVLDILAAAPAPLTIPELVKLTGKTYPTIKLALTQGNAQKTNSHPARWYLGSTSRAVLPHAAAESIVVASYHDSETLPARWNEGRQRITDQLGDIQIVPEADIKTLIAVFESGASILATLAYRLNLVKDYPDWYDLLTNGKNDDGNLRPETPRDDSDDSAVRHSDAGDAGDDARDELPTEAPRTAEPEEHAG